MLAFQRPYKIENHTVDETRELGLGPKKGRFSIAAAIVQKWWLAIVMQGLICQNIKDSNIAK